MSYLKFMMTRVTSRRKNARGARFCRSFPPRRQTSKIQTSSLVIMWTIFALMLVFSTDGMFYALLTFQWEVWLVQRQSTLNLGNLGRNLFPSSFALCLRFLSEFVNVWLKMWFQSCFWSADLVFPRSLFSKLWKMDPVPTISSKLLWKEVCIEIIIYPRCLCPKRRI